MYIGAPGAFDRVGSVVRYPATGNDFNHTSYDYLTNGTLQEFFNPHNLTEFTDSYLGVYNAGYIYPLFINWKSIRIIML